MPTIGETLRETREKRKISVDVAAKAVKVKNEVLEGIERDDFSAFAAPLYARGILRLYASFLSLEPETLVEEYNKAHPAPKPRSSSQFATGERDQIMSRRRAVVISTVSKPSDLSPRGVAGLVGVVIFLAVLIWVLSSSRKPGPEIIEPGLVPRMTETQPLSQPARGEAHHEESVSPAGTAVVPSLATDGAPPSATNSDGAVPALEVRPDERP